MDYTHISARRVLMAFALTAFVALTPVVFLFLKSGPIGFLGTHGGYRGVVLGVETVALALVLIGLLSTAVLFGRRVVRRPTRV
ncbi:MAG: hypothetical protein JWR83_1156 [Aeromicrobium sp.]|nr:hypothetical protein [Aeromicrobium sp.]